ncbi:MAG: SIMPL domain-containing protein [Clostridia bacterium]|nr:SIMPL domain-containing protein [Clostridia bacterium]
MKKTMMFGVVALLVAALFIGNSGIFTQEAQADVDGIANVVSVNGVGSITVKPDIAYISVGVETSDADANKAQTDNSKAMNEVMAALKALGIKDDDIKTTQYSVYDRYDYIDGKQTNKTYQVTNMVQVTVRDINQVGDVIDAASLAGANSVSNIQFGIADESAAYQEALKLAMASAKGKAEAILGTFGEVVTAPSKVTETSYFSGVVRSDYAYAKAEMAVMDTPVSSGELTITANVTVEYTY